MTNGQGRMAVDFLLQARAEPGTPVSSPSSELSDVPVPFKPSPDMDFPLRNLNASPAVGIMELANAAEMAAAAEALDRIPFSPVSTNSNSSMEDHIDRFNATLRLQTPSPPPTHPQPHLQQHHTPPSPTYQPHPQPPPQPAPSTQQRAPQSSSRNNVCATCGEAFNQRIRFLHHLLSVHGMTYYETRPILPCRKCPSAFMRNTDRSKHDACVHQKLRPFECKAPNCSSSFFFAKDLSKHRSTVHLRYKPFPCSICKKPFGKREHMTSHVKRVHQKLRPFKCDVCGIRLASKYNLQGHLKTAAHAAAQTLANRDAVNRTQPARRPPAC